MKRSRRVAINLIVDDRDNILMGRRNNNDKFTVPAGHIGHKEDPHLAAIRELKEETGLDALDVRLVGAHWDRDKNLFLYLFSVTVDPAQQIDVSGDPDKECNAWTYINPNDVLSELHVPLEDNIALKYWAKE
jgi:8-oxo-dGTP pyrophosphatase MutT (NUDIX family)